MCGSDIGWRATRFACDVWYSPRVPRYAFSMRCPVLTSAMLLPAVASSLEAVIGEGVTGH
eukprot:266802-Rhodomonas_salina.1